MGSGATVLAGVCFCLTDGLIQIGHADIILGIHGHIVVPLSTVNGSHGQGYEEGIAGASDHIGHAGLDQQVQALSQVIHLAIAVLIGLIHDLATVFNSLFQGVLSGGSISGQGIAQCLVQYIAGEVVGAALSGVGICGSQADSLQHGVISEAIEDTHLIGAVLLPAVSRDRCYFQVGKLNALNGIAIGQVIGSTVVGKALVTQHVVDMLIIEAGRYVGSAIPLAILLCASQVVLIEFQGCLLGCVNGSCRYICGECRRDQGQRHDGCHQQRKKAIHFFHRSFSFVILSFFVLINIKSSCHQSKSCQGIHTCKANTTGEG